MKKRIALLLTFVLVLSMALCACGEKKENLVGTWKGTIDMAEAFNEEIAAADPTMGDYLKLESFDLPLILELKEDGTCKLSVDSEGMTETMNKLVEDVTAGMEAYLVEMFAAQGLEIDLDEALSEMGVSMDELVAEMTAGFTSEDAFAEFTTEGKYKAEDGKLWISDSLDTEIDIEVYNTYTLDGDTLTLDIGTEEIEEDMAKYMFPMTLKRAA